MNRSTVYLITAGVLALLALLLNREMVPAHAARAPDSPPGPRKPRDFPPYGEEIPSEPRPPPVAHGACRGYTWSFKEQRGAYTRVGVDFEASDGYRGDTDCNRTLPIVCVRPLAELEQVPSAVQVSRYQGWFGGEVALSRPVEGTRLTSRAAADAQCAQSLGEGWRMGEHHDGRGSVGWSFWARGEIPAGVRFWVAINDQPANPWNFLRSL